MINNYPYKLHINKITTTIISMYIGIYVSGYVTVCMYVPVCMHVYGIIKLCMQKFVFMFVCMYVCMYV